MVRPDQVSLGVLVNAVPRDAVDDAVAVCGVREKRSDGKLPAHVITYLTLALCLFPDDDYEEVATKVTGSLDRWGCWNAAWTVPTASAITQARKRLGREVFAGVVRTQLRPGRRRGRSDRARPWRWAPRAGRSCAGGGCWRSTGSRSTCPTARRTRPSSATPAPGTTGRRSPRPGWSRWPSAAPTPSWPPRSTPTGVGEKTLAQRLYPRLRADELLTADRGFYSWQAWDTAAATGAALLWRAPTQLELPVVRVLRRRDLPHRADHAHHPRCAAASGCWPPPAPVPTSPTSTPSPTPSTSADCRSSTWPGSSSTTCPTGSATAPAS